MGIEEFSKYIGVNCSHLNQRIPCKKDQEKFTRNWQQRFARVFKEGSEEQTFIWNIRVHKALKEIFTSSSFYQESLIAKESNSWASFFFLSYYSLFHALLCCVYMVPEESIDKLSEITHSKLIKVFKSHFCDKHPHVINEKIVELFYLARFKREYYSYNMPPNDFLYDINGDMKPDIVLPYYLRCAFQLASILSEFVESACDKHGKKIENKYQYHALVTDYYSKVNSGKHPKTEEYLLHYVDKLRMREALEYPSPIAFVIELEHFTDEFRKYEGSIRPRYADGSEIDPASFVYKAIR